jgi:serine/threonine protein kinase
MRDRDQIVLIDFALSKKVVEKHPYGCGTPGYIAPEVYTDERTYTASDMYSLGVIVGQMLEVFLPGVSLHYLGSKLVRHPTTTFICKKLEQILLERDLDWKPILYHAADLVMKLLQCDHESRITAQEVLDHPFLLSNDADFSKYTKDSVSKKLVMQRPISSYKKPIVFFRG